MRVLSLALRLAFLFMATNFVAAVPLSLTGNIISPALRNLRPRDGLGDAAEQLIDNISNATTRIQFLNGEQTSMTSGTSKPGVDTNPDPEIIEEIDHALLQVVLKDTPPSVLANYILWRYVDVSIELPPGPAAVCDLLGALSETLITLDGVGKITRDLQTNVIKLLGDILDLLNFLQHLVISPDLPKDTPLYTLISTVWGMVNQLSQTVGGPNVTVSANI